MDRLRNQLEGATETIIEDMSDLNVNGIDRHISQLKEILDEIRPLVFKSHSPITLV